MRYLIVAALMLATALPAFAFNHQDAQRRQVVRELSLHGLNVDPAALSDAQVRHIYLILNENQSEGKKLGLIRSVLGGGNSLRGVLFN